MQESARPRQTFRTILVNNSSQFSSSSVSPNPLPQAARVAHYAFDCYTPPACEILPVSQLRPARAAHDANELNMKSIVNPSFRYAASLDTDLEKTFRRIWRELEKREKAQPNSEGGQTALRLECNGEIIDIGSIDGIGIRDSAPGMQLITFVCPRCGRAHESLRFR
jgi:hypothetical protein